jgi:hypothetical protein
MNGCDRERLCRRWAWSASLFAATILLLCVTAAGASASGTPFDVEPVAGLPGADRGYFDLRPEPGSSTRLAVMLHNPGDEDVTVLLKAVTGETGALGDIGYAVLEKPVEAMATWVTLEQDEVPLAAGEQREVGLTVTVPDGARPGDHVCGLAAWVPVAKPSPTANTGETEAAITVTMQPRRIIPITARVPGTATSLLTVTGVETAVTAQGLQLLIGIVNDGQLFARGDGVIEVDGPGVQGFEKAFPLGTTVPGTAMAYPVDWADHAENGTYAVEVRVRYDDGAKLAEWSGTFTVGEKEQGQIEDRVATPATAGASNLGWYIIAALGALILLLAGILLGRRRTA